MTGSQLGREGVKMLKAQLDEIVPSVDGSAFLMLIKTEQGEVVPIVIGALEAQAINVSLLGVQLERPLTADLVISVLEIFGASIQRIEINELSNNVYYARIVVENRGIEYEIDARPSDALALQVRTKAPLYIAESVVEAAKLREDFGPGGAEA